VLASLPFGAESNALLERAYGYLRNNQILEDVPRAEHYYRHPSRGGWPFSNRAHGWPITDCTAEGLKCALALEGRFVPVIPEELLRESVHLILTWQNDDGGWATYERQRAGGWLERLNPSRVFGDIMVDRSYVECTSACLQALVRAQRRFGRNPRIDRALARGLRFLLRQQRRDGSFEGSWGVCFTYGTWFGVTGLLAAGAGKRKAEVRRACAFLLSKQRPDGGWGEDGESCRERRYVQAPVPSVAQTAWALMTLVRAGDPSVQAQRRAVQLLLDRQAADGGWEREPMVGVFNRTCLINYDNYRHYFPLWALGEWVTSPLADAC
ncbi:MAG TPA: prenyltransferase/squalene oxidase repeat-containing protein, partial [Polyangiaceae bacterium]